MTVSRFVCTARVMHGGAQVRFARIFRVWTTRRVYGKWLDWMRARRNRRRKAALLEALRVPRNQLEEMVCLRHVHL